MIAVTNGMPSAVEVASSWLVIWKQPSPSIAITRRSGRPAFAPSAAGTANPIVPSPPEFTQVRGSVNRQNCDAHIWCWPTPATTIASPFVCSYRRSMQNCGLSGPSAGWS